AGAFTLPSVNGNMPAPRSAIVGSLAEGSKTESVAGSVAGPLGRVTTSASGVPLAVGPRVANPPPALTAVSVPTSPPEPGPSGTGLPTRATAVGSLVSSVTR